MATQQKNAIETLEQGNVYFFYRPKVEQEHPEQLEDVQQMHMVLSPHGAKRHRLTLIGRKHLPDPGEKQDRVWGFVEAVEQDPKRIVRELGEETYETKTRGTRHRPAARPAGEGVYRLLRHGDHTHLVYALELPKHPGDVQEEMKLEEEASYIISIKNPSQPAPKGAGLRPKQGAAYPKNLQEKFSQRRFIDADPPELLDYAGSQFLLISAAEDVSEELGLDLNPQDEDASRAEIFNDLRLEKSSQPIEPLLKGEWE